jgi:anti-sigma-K factor RskA
MTDSTHLTLHECSGLYVLGSLGRDDAAAFEAHLADCDVCTEEVRSLRETSAALPFSVPMVDPPAGLRDRVLAIANRAPGGSVTPLTSRSSSVAADTGATGTSSGRTMLWAGWLSAAAMMLLAVGIGRYAVNVNHQLADVELRLVDAMGRLQDSQTQLASARSDAAGVRASLALLTSPDAIDMRLRGLAPAPQARARALVSRSRGILFAASNLPPLPPARVYQLWFLTAGAPVSAGLVQPDAQGTVTATFDGPASVPEATGFAVSIEPEGGVPSPTGALYLATQ